MSWITAILQLYSQEADLFGNVIVKRLNIRLFDLLARFHYILNLPRRKISGTDCSKLTTLLVNVSLKLKNVNITNTLLFFVGKCENLLQCKRFSHFSNKK